MRINTNLSAMTALNNSTKTTALAGNSMEKLSSGLKINKAGDNAAGLAISEKMRSQIRGLDQASQNAQDGISVVQTAEGAMEEIGNITQRMRELTVQSANETNSTEDRSKITEELTQLNKEITRIAENTQFNGINLLDGGSITTIVGKDAEVEFANTDMATIENISGKFEEFNVANIKIEYNAAGAANGTDNAVTITLLDKNGDVIATGKGDLGAGEDSSTGTATAIKFTDASGNTLQDSKGQDLKLDITLSDDTLTSGNLEAMTDGITGAFNPATAAGSTGAGLDLNLQVGANKDQNLTINISNVTSEALGIDQSDIDNISAGTDADKSTQTAAANKFIEKLDEAISKLNTSRANLGATQNRLETAQSNLTTSSENLTAAESRIRDVDVADEMMNLSKLNLINQAAQAMMTQAKSQPEGVMQLLR